MSIICSLGDGKFNALNLTDQIFGKLESQNFAKNMIDSF